MSIREGEQEEIPPAFQMTPDFLDDWLGSHVTALVVQGYVVRLSREGGWRYP
jgi:hypothetical protein